MPARARECSRCGFRLLEDDWTGWRDPDPDRAKSISTPSRRAAALAGGAAAAVVALALAAALLISAGGEPEGGGDAQAGEDRRARPEVISDSPLSDRETETRLEERFTSMPDDDTAAARCTPRDPRPAHAVRRCEVRYPNGTELTVLVVTSARGREVLGRILRD